MNSEESLNPKDWILFAEEDLRSAQALFDHEDEFPHTIAYHCHQSVEKYLKAVLLVKTGTHPKTHSLIALLNICVHEDDSLETVRLPCELLDPLYLEDKYPFETPSFSDEELKSFIDAAQEVQRVISSKVSRG